MLRYKVPKVLKLPPTSKWSQTTSGILTDMNVIKNKLNESKNRIDPIYENKPLYRKFSVFESKVYLYDLLRGDSGILAKEYNAENVTNAYLKMYEICHEFIANYIDNNLRKNNELASFHAAEAPGTFIKAIQHYITSHPKFENLQWKWLASSYRGKGEHLGDSYGLIEDNPDKWVWGADNTGDIMSSDNIRWFKNKVSKTFDTPIHLYTSDAKTAIKDFNEEENELMKLFYGCCICGLTVLSKGGMMVVKTFTLLENASISMLYLLSYFFEELYIVKPDTSRSVNSEIYLVGLNITPPSKLQISKLQSILDQPDDIINVFDISLIPIEFIDQIKTINTELVDKQIQALDRLMDLWNKYSNKSISVVDMHMRKIKEKTAADWLLKFDMQPLNN